jgi:arsenate reductase
MSVFSGKIMLYSKAEISAEVGTTAYYTYLLRCEDGSLYAGITTDLRRRFAEHAGQNGRGARYTALRRPIRFEAAWKSPDRAGASRLERRLKALAKPEKERVVGGDAPQGLDLSSYAKIHITDNGGIVMVFVCYPKCTTCKKARAFLDERGIDYDLRDIKAEKPGEAELRAWHAASGLPLKRFFNTSGLQYRALDLSKRLPTLSEDEQFALLATDGMLVKRPILVGGDFVLVGFQEAGWKERL